MLKTEEPITHSEESENMKKTKEINESDTKKLIFICRKKVLYTIYFEEQDRLYLERSN